MAQLRDGAPAPNNPFPLLPLRSGALLPGITMAFSVGRPRSVKLVESLHPGDVIGVASQRDPRVSEPEMDDLHAAGSFARVVQIARQGDRGYRLALEGLGRFRLLSIDTDEPYWNASGEVLSDTRADDPESELLAKALKKHVLEWTRERGGKLDDNLVREQDPSLLADRIAAGLGLDTEHVARVLETADVPDRLRLVLELIGEAEARADLSAKIDQDVRERLGKHQREAILREQMRAIQKELGEDPEESDVEKLRQRLDAASLPEEVQEVADRELERFQASGGQGPESNVIRTYLDWLAELPWEARAEIVDDLDAIAKQLDADHSGLDDVKKRILEHMAVQKLSGNPRGTILCLVGPPGVGKTSLGQSIAKATGRPFSRIALGGVRDEAEIRGHRRTYVGALPGRIVNALRKAGAKNPVMLLDEIDKTMQSWAGSPEAALLEVLDPEQNDTFTDHYLEVPFDLSEVLFLTTANSLDTLSAPLRDRLEIVEIGGYTVAEKLTIARNHLIKKRMEECGVPFEAVHLSDDALRAIIEGYTREAGVRQLDREITRLGRKLALEVARAADDTPIEFEIGSEKLVELLGKPRFDTELAEHAAKPGVATGLAWTPVGGDVLFVETSRMPGKGRLEITGQLGDVMKESARAAVTYVRSHADGLGIPPSGFADQDLHIHIPQGAVPKDGPSAGVTMFTAIASLLSERSVRADTAMTGECTLRGRVLPVGGIKAKVLAAHRAGIKRVILPRKNERDLDDVPAETRAELDFVLVDDMGEVLEAALEQAPAPKPMLSGRGGPVGDGATADA